MKVKIYTVSTCKTCLLTKSYFDKIGIEYEDIDCDKNLEETLAVMKMAGSEELPIVQYDENNFILGYNTDNYDKLAKLYKN